MGSKKRIKKEDVRFFTVSEYNSDDSLDSCFINQEILFQKHKKLLIKRDRASGDELANLNRQIKKIEEQAKANYKKVKNILGDDLETSIEEAESKDLKAKRPLTKKKKS